MLPTIVLMSCAVAAATCDAALLPDQAPYLNAKHRYPVGNGVAMAVGEASGEWIQLAGPGYSTPNFITKESLSLSIDGVEKPLRVEMKRARKTGVYYGVTRCGDLQVRLIDYACRGQAWISRLVMIDNTSATASHELRVGAAIVSSTAAGITHWLVEDANHAACGVALMAGTSANVTYAGNLFADRTVVISFTDPGATASLAGDTSTLETKTTRLPPGNSWQVSLGHYFREDSTPDSQCVDRIRAMNSVEDLKVSIAEWRSWFDQVGPGYQLGNIKDERARDLVEGALAIIKTNQSQDGGFIAHSTFYKNGFIRDAALGLRGLAATGHFDESKQWLIWVDNKFGLFRHIPDAVNCEPSLKDPTHHFDMGNPDVEETGWILLCARDYYRATNDLQTLNGVHRTLQYCMDIQLKDAAANGYKLEFNGDETEICAAVNVTGAGTAMGGSAQKQDWSLSSIAMCAASLDFYIEYLRARGEDVTAYRNTQTGTTMNLNAELTNLLKAMDDTFWRTDVPESPGGFHDAFRRKSDMAWPLKRIVNFTLMPVYFGAPYSIQKKAADVSAMAQYFDPKTGFLQLVPGVDNGFDGHDLGYLLWDLVEVGDARKTEVYQALINGPTADCWGSFSEAYNAKGYPNNHDLRTLETGCNVSAIAKYWNLGPPGRINY